MKSTRTELMGACAVLHKVRKWKGTVKVWVDNDNVVRGLEKRLGIVRADAVWAVAETWGLTHRSWNRAGRFSWGWVMMVICGRKWICH